MPWKACCNSWSYQKPHPASEQTANRVMFVRDDGVSHVANRPKERPSRASIAWCLLGCIVLFLARWMS